MSRLRNYYYKHLRPKLKKQFSKENIHDVPYITKVVVSMGIAEASRDKKAVQNCIDELTLITGQAPVVTKAKKSISNFKLREGQPIGLKVTLRKYRMYDFLSRLCNIVAPLIRDFRGFKPKPDGRGSYSIGIEDHTIFPELDLDKVQRNNGLNITIVTSANTDEECIELLRQLGVPFRNRPVVVVEGEE